MDGSTYYRVRHWKANPLEKLAPEVVNLVSEKNSKVTRTTNITNCYSYMKDLNKGRYKNKRYDYLTGAVEVFENGELKSLTMGGNIVTGEVDGDWLKVNTLPVGTEDDQPSADDKNYETNPEQIHSYCCITKKGDKWVTPPNHGPIYWPLVCDEPLYIKLKELEEFPHLPQEVKVTEPKLKVYSEPKDDGTPVAELAVNQKVTVLEYAPRGSHVWGKIDKGWILLEYYSEVETYEQDNKTRKWSHYYTGTMHYYTSWKMTTEPPPGLVTKHSDDKIGY